MASDERGFLVLGDVAIRREDRPLVVFFHGFMTSPSSYRTVLTMLATEALVAAPRMYRPGPAVLAGRPSVVQEAEAAVGIVEQLVAEHRPGELWLGGHSRGGQVAWLVAEHVGPSGVIVIDPVDGVGRNPTGLHAAARPATFTARTLVIGAGRGGRCAPDAMNHEHFAAAAPSGSVHLVIATMGHGDLLDDRAAGLARRMCGGSEHPDLDRRTVGLLAAGFLHGALPTGNDLPSPVEMR